MVKQRFKTRGVWLVLRKETRRSCLPVFRLRKCIRLVLMSIQKKTSTTSRIWQENSQNGRPQKTPWTRAPMVEMCHHQRNWYLSTNQETYRGLLRLFLVLRKRRELKRWWAIVLSTKKWLKTPKDREKMGLRPLSIRMPPPLKTEKAHRSSPRLLTPLLVHQLKATPTRRAATTIWIESRNSRGL